MDDSNIDQEKMFEQSFGRKPNGKVTVNIVLLQNGQKQYQFNEEPEVGPDNNWFE